MLAIAELPEDVRTRLGAAGPGAVEALEAFVAEARREHPALVFDVGGFVAHVLSHVSEEAHVTEQLGSMRAADLLVAYACIGGDRAAIELFERRCFDEIPFAHARVRPKVAVDEIAQSMRDRLFVRSPDAPPKVAQYAGAGDLRAWFRVVLMRYLLNDVTRGPREIELDEAMLDLLPGNIPDAEIQHAREMYGPALKEALVDTIAALQPRERTLLRMAVCDGLTVDAIGAVYGVHRATAARWVASARDELQRGTRERLRVKLGARDESIASLLRLLASQVDISLRGHLLASHAGPPKE